MVVVNSTDIACQSNCTLVTLNCTDGSNKLLNFLRGQNVLPNNKNISPQCPTFSYYECSGNIVNLNKLLSGYYTSEKDANGNVINKPGSVLKCSHGGYFDSDSYSIQALGGINKDAGFYFFSPHATLHLAAANLAILHTEYFFNQIRANIGDTKYQAFLKINLK